jgi:hypothetical protein
MYFLPPVPEQMALSNSHSPSWAIEGPNSTFPSLALVGPLLTPPHPMSTIQSVPGGKVNILGVHSISHSKKKFI